MMMLSPVRPPTPKPHPPPPLLPCLVGHLEAIASWVSGVEPLAREWRGGEGEGGWLVAVD